LTPSLKKWRDGLQLNHVSPKPIGKTNAERLWGIDFGPRSHFQATAIGFIASARFSTVA
jgi:hypothetical protein